MRSLQSRLGLSLSLILVLVFAGLWFIVNNAIRNLAEDYIVSRLSHDAESLVAATNINKDGTLSLNSQRLDQLYMRPFSGHYFKITTPKEVQRSRSLWDEDIVLAMTVPNNGGRHYVTGPQNQTLLVLQLVFTKQGHELKVTVAEDFSPVQADITAFQQRFALLASLTLLVLITLQVLVLKGGLLSLQRTQKQIHELELGERDSLDNRVPDEIRPLVDETNRLFGLLVGRLQRYRTALGDLAHSLKKPLTVLRQLASDKAVLEQPKLHKELERQIDDMQRLTDRILKRERLAGGGPVASRFSVKRDLPDLVSTLEHIYKEKKISIDEQIENDGALPFDRDDMLELLGNMLDNACKWSHHSVRISLSRSSQNMIIFCVEDDGPGIDADLHSRLLQRGARLDESVKGHGIGLSIVQDIISQYRGQIQFSKSGEFGGLQVEVQLPIPQRGANS